MSETDHSSHQHGTPARDSVHHEPNPYWKRAHTDWRFWVAFILMFAAITIYAVTNDLSFFPHFQRQQPSSAGRR